MRSGDEKAKTKVAFFKLSGRGGVDVDEDEAVVLLEERVKDGDCEAKWMLGLCCEYGIGTEQNIERAQNLYVDSGSVGFFFFDSLHTTPCPGSGVIRMECL